MGSSPTPTPQASSGLTSNVAAALGYIFPVGIFFLVLDPFKNDKFVRFHAFQAIFYWIVCFVIGWGLVIALPWTLWPLFWLVRLAMFVGWLILVIKAYQNEKFKLPVIGDIAEKQAGA